MKEREFYEIEIVVHKGVKSARIDTNTEIQQRSIPPFEKIIDY